VEAPGVRPPAPGEREVDRSSYVFCVLTQFHRHLKRSDIYAEASERPSGPATRRERVGERKETVLTVLSLPESPDELLSTHARVLDEAYRDFTASLAANTAVSIDDDGRLHVERLTAIPDPRAWSTCWSTCAGRCAPCCPGSTCPRSSWR